MAHNPSLNTPGGYRPASRGRSGLQTAREGAFSYLVVSGAVGPLRAAAEEVRARSGEQARGGGAEGQLPLVGTPRSPQSPVRRRDLLRKEVIQGEPGQELRMKNLEF